MALAFRFNKNAEVLPCLPTGWIFFPERGILKKAAIEWIAGCIKGVYLKFTPAHCRTFILGGWQGELYFVSEPRELTSRIG